jgi:hypothetical protein
MPALSSKNVSGYDARNLDIGNEVISQVRRLMPYGSGNQVTDYQRTEGESARRTRLAYAMHEREGEGVFKPRLLASIASQYGAGNCDMTGAMAYSLLRGALTEEFVVSFVQVKEHTFAAFRHWTQEPEDAVIVDPWPPQGMAVMAKDHFCSGRKEVARTDKFGKKDPAVDANATERLTLRKDKYMFLDLVIENDIKVDPQVPAFQGYQHLLCSNTVSMYLDQNNIPVAPPLSRSMMEAPLMPGAPPDAEAVVEP